MSLRFKEYRKLKGISKNKLSEDTGIAIRTLTSWEKENGIIPSISSLNTLAEGLGCPLSEVVDLFIDDKHDDTNQNSFTLHDHKDKLYKNILMLPMYLQKKGLSGAATVFGNNYMYTFDIVFYDIKPPFYMSDSGELIQNNLYVYLLDRCFNTFIIDLRKVAKFEILNESINSSYITFTIQEGDRLDNVSVLFTSMPGINPYYFNTYHKMEKYKILGHFLKDLRKKNNITQQELCDILQNFYSKKRTGTKYSSNTISVKTLSKWETGDTQVPIDAFYLICLYFEADFQNAITCYENGFYFSDAVYIKTGLVHYSKKVSTLGTLERFINFYSAFMSVACTKTESPIGVLKDENEYEVMIDDISVDPDGILIMSSSNEPSRINNIVSIQSVDCKANLVFSFIISENKKNEVRKYTISLSLV